ncbi:MAG: DUF3786 domain-containing protein [Anaerolineae bacterium]
MGKEGHTPNTIAQKGISGEELAWQTLVKSDPEKIQRRAKVTYDQASQVYTLTSFGCDLGISLKDNRIFGFLPEGEALLDKLDSSTGLTLLWYLISAKDIPISGKWVRPDSLPGGQIYVKGSHVLPVDQIAEKYGSDAQAFIDIGKQFGGDVLDYGDAAIRFLPFPRVPVALTLWTADEEFPARANLLVDANCELQIPTDIIWATCMLSLELML